MGWLVSQAAKIAGPRVLLGVVAAGIVAVCVLGGLLYWSIQRNGSLAEQRDQAVEAAERNAERAKELLADIERRDQLDAAFRSAIDNIEGRFSGLSKEISAAVEAASRRISLMPACACS